MSSGILRRVVRVALAALLACAGVVAWADGVQLRAKHAELAPALRENVYGRPLYIDSSENGSTLQGDVYAVLDHPFETVSRTLRQPDDWCDILILPFNTKYCHAVPADGGTVLAMRIGRKVDQPVEDAYRLDLQWRPVASGRDYFETRLAADEGPVGTRDYRIVLSATPLQNGKTFMHLHYAYAAGGMGRFAMQAYLSTAGASKVGFTIVGRDGGGHPQYIGGVRGAIERNVMRYYLAIEAHLASLSAPPGRQLEKRLRTWFDASEQYALQLHEMDRGTYIALKRSEHDRQQQALVAGPAPAR